MQLCKILNHLLYIAPGQPLIISPLVKLLRPSWTGKESVAFGVQLL